jgi:hypothetical protein
MSLGTSRLLDEPPDLQLPIKYQALGGTLHQSWQLQVQGCLTTPRNPMLRVRFSEASQATCLCLSLAEQELLTPVQSATIRSVREQASSTPVLVSSD